MLRMVALATVVVLSPVISIGASIVLWLAVRSYPGLAVFLPGFDNAATWRDAVWPALPAVAIVAIVIACAAIEVGALGYDRSALKRIIELSTPSAKNDLFYLLLKTLGGAQILIFIMSFGLGYAGAHYLENKFSLALLAGSPYAAQFAALLIVHTFMFYWTHRLMHVRRLWQIHKVHHAAEELNIVTPLRNHPVDGLINLFLYAAPLAMLGVSPIVAAVYLGWNAAYQCLVHSSIEGRCRWLEAIIITPAAHRLHHSVDDRHWNRNFGILTFWDWLFGTYLPPDESPEKLGVDDGLFNSGRPLNELWTVFVAWVRSLA